MDTQVQNRDHPTLPRGAPCFSLTPQPPRTHAVPSTTSACPSPAAIPLPGSPSGRGPPGDAQPGCGRPPDQFPSPLASGSAPGPTVLPQPAVGSPPAVERWPEAGGGAELRPRVGGSGACVHPPGFWPGCRGDNKKQGLGSVGVWMWLNRKGFFIWCCLGVLAANGVSHSFRNAVCLLLESLIPPTK